MEIRHVRRHPLSNHVRPVDDFRLLHLLGDGICRPLQLCLDGFQHLLPSRGQISFTQCQILPIS